MCREVSAQPKTFTFSAVIIILLETYNAHADSRKKSCNIVCRIIHMSTSVFILQRAGEAVSEAGSTVKASLKNATVAIHVAAKVSCVPSSSPGQTLPLLGVK